MLEKFKLEQELLILVCRIKAKSIHLIGDFKRPYSKQLSTQEFIMTLQGLSWELETAGAKH